MEEDSRVSSHWRRCLGFSGDVEESLKSASSSRNPVEMFTDLQLQLEQLALSLPLLLVQPLLHLLQVQILHLQQLLQFGIFGFHCQQRSVTCWRWARLTAVMIRVVVSWHQQASGEEACGSSSEGRRQLQKPAAPHTWAEAAQQSLGSGAVMSVSMRMLRGCHQGCYEAVTRLLWGCYKAVTRLLQGCYEAVDEAVAKRLPVAI